MSVDYTPNIASYLETGTFRFWCQKVLPLVYDESLSYYELLCKVVNYLNNVIGNVDGLHSDITELNTAYIMLRDFVNNYFDTPEMRQDISDKLDEMAENGVLTNLVNEALHLQYDTLKRKILPISGTLFELSSDTRQTHIHVLRRVESQNNLTGKYTARRVAFRVGSANFTISLNGDNPQTFGMVNYLRDYEVSVGALYRCTFDTDYDFEYKVFLDGIEVEDFTEFAVNSDHTSIIIYKKQSDSEVIITVIDASGITIWMNYTFDGARTLPNIQWIISNVNYWTDVYNSNNGVQITKARNNKTVGLLQDSTLTSGVWHKVKITW